MDDPQNDKPTALLRMAMRLYNSGYHAGHHDTVETGYVDIFSCDMENYHEDEAREIVQDFLGSNLTDQDMRDFQTIFDDAPLPLANVNAEIPPAQNSTSARKTEAVSSSNLFGIFFRAMPFFSLLVACFLAILGFKVWSVFVFILGCLVVVVGRETTAKCSRPYENSGQ